MTVHDPELHQLRLAAAAKVPTAWFTLGSALVARQQMEEAYSWHLRAAQAGLANAQIETARMLMYGVGTDTDVVGAIGWLLRAEQAGSPIAGYFLALIALGGTAMPNDSRINERLFTAMQADYPPALRAAAIHFGRKPNEADQVSSLQLFERAAERGDAVSARLLAERLDRGEGCAPQPKAAAQLRVQLAQRGIGPLPRIAVPLPPPDRRPARRLALEEHLDLPPVQLLSARPKVMQVDRLLSADECRLLAACAEPMLRPSRTVDPETGLPRAIELRTSHDAAFDPVTEDLSLRLVQVRMAHAARLPLPNAEHLVVLRYQPGQEYRPHRDYCPPGAIERDHPEAGNRARTICVYLNEVEAGGETEFPVAGVRVQPQAGRAVIFDNLHDDGSPDVDSLHAGAPVQRGEKWLATLWIRQGQYRGF
ncbi:2OG-Fe(II) oxygenase [Cognatilysobacter tabacisoli]|uniref:2OG-Fe(II) oxygenase n=1 Tax=Cognatilysobacter tabacisoli TaxID=2315424 RepID=UPI001E401BF0|nr:2OG-Fe(II) oxygenase [Lysobacter tabacisoli]